MTLSLPTMLSFDHPAIQLENAGGKGANLARLAQAGYPVPGGFIVSTAAYQAFVQANQLEGRIQARLADLPPADPAALEAASGDIRLWFAAGSLPEDLGEALRRAYAALGQPAVAVRSSATAEDLPDLSFAGQQDTYLNVLGEGALLEAVRRCWSSLWTARAIGYRQRNHLAQTGLALAVVVQQMVQSEVSGVMFTANPLSGLRSEQVIDATFGLGEALVSGQVEPDHYVVAQEGQPPHLFIQAKTLGAKALAIHSQPGGGVATAQAEAAQTQALPDAQILALAELGRQVQAEYGFPQDIEWAWAGGKLYLLQARPITSLFPVPEISLDPLVIWFSFGSVQGMLGPVTPLGQEGLRAVLAGAGKVFGVKMKVEEIRVFVSAGERIWIRISDLMRNPIGNRIFGGAIGFLEPSIAQIMKPLAADPRLGAGQGKLKLSTIWRLVRFFAPVLVRMLRNTLQPEKARLRLDVCIESFISTAHVPPAADRFGRLANTAAFIRERIASAFPFILPQFVPVFGPSMAALNLLNHIAGKDRALVLEMTRGLANNVTTEMDLALWQTATEIKADAEAGKLFDSSPAAELARQYLSGSLPPAAQAAIERFMEKYGMRGVGEVDFGQPRWREEPTPVMFTLQSYLKIDADKAPDLVFARGQHAAGLAIEELAAIARRQPGGRIKEKLVRGAARRIRVLMGARESPKFFAIRSMGIGRQALLEVGKEFVAAGELERPDDLVFLRLAELEALASTAPGGLPAAGDGGQSGGESGARPWKALIAQRRAAYERELLRKQAPRVLVSDGRAFYEGLDAEATGGSLITGSPVSPGLVEGVVHVVLDPNSTRLAPGEILVCAGTDPAWTPLFLAAGGLITEVGGVMTHGSVVAREYGIPAVVGVHQATQRLKTGQRIRLDGTRGLIQVLE